MSVWIVGGMAIAAVLAIGALGGASVAALTRSSPDAVSSRWLFKHWTAEDEASGRVRRSIEKASVQ